MSDKIERLKDSTLGHLEGSWSTDANEGDHTEAALTGISRAGIRAPKSIP